MNLYARCLGSERAFSLLLSILRGEQTHKMAGSREAARFLLPVSHTAHHRAARTPAPPSIYRALARTGLFITGSTVEYSPRTGSDFGHYSALVELHPVPFWERGHFEDKSAIFEKL